MQYNSHNNTPHSSSHYPQASRQNEWWWWQDMQDITSMYSWCVCALLAGVGKACCCRRPRAPLEHHQPRRTNSRPLERPQTWVVAVCCAACKPHGRLERMWQPLCRIHAHCGPTGRMQVVQQICGSGRGDDRSWILFRPLGSNMASSVRQVFSDCPTTTAIHTN